jgi:hypothetical protein
MGNLYTIVLTYNTFLPPRLSAHFFDITRGTPVEDYCPYEI